MENFIFCAVNDSLSVVIISSEDKRLKTLSNIAQIVEQIKIKKRGQRVSQQTIYTSTALAHM